MRHTSLPPRLDADTEHPDQDEDIQMHSDSEQQLSNSPPAEPPARIAARFNHSRRASRAASSRKSSASSSRRNSFSSLHSGRSNLSCHGGPFSTHVAQHLRRASIIDARRARLAERAAHAEQVRLRAQAAKAAPRTSRSAEERAQERAQAAREAREKHLAQVAAACAEEVKRAKRVAEDMKERKEREEERMRAEMEEKQASAERRRLLYEQKREQRRRRGSSNTRIGGLPAVPETRVNVPTWKPKTRDIAARVVQKAWREYRLRAVARQFLALQLDVEHVQASSFETASALLLQDQVVLTTERLLAIAHLIDPEDDEAEKSARVKTFLSAYLVLCYPQQVLSDHGLQEEDLVNKAKVLLMEVQRLLSKKPILGTFSRSSEMIQSLSKANDNFQRAFKAWKAGDSSNLVETMVLQFVELDAIVQTTKNDTAGGAADEYRQGVKQNQAMILARLKRLVGKQEAMRLLSSAVNKRRKDDVAKRRALKNKPRGTPATSTNTPILPQSRANADPDRASEPVFSSRDLAQVLAPLPDNRTLVHELALDREWRMDADRTREVRQTLRRAVYQTIREDLILGKGDYWILNMIETIREKLLRTVIKGGSMYKMLNENLDTDLIKQQLANGNFSHERFFKYMASVLPKLVSPARDADVRDFANDNSSDFTERLEKLFRIIEFLSLDYANFMLQQSASKLIQSAPSYESNCFTEDYGPGTAKIPKTKTWWRAARQTTMNDLARRPPSPASASSMTPPPTPPRGSPLPLAVKPTAERIYTTGLVDLFIGLPSPSLGHDTPETLHLDLSRISDARTSVQRIIATSTVLLTAKNALKRDVRTPWRNVAQRMWDISAQAEEQSKSQDILSSPDLEAIGTGYMVAIESAQILPPAVKNALSGTVKRVLIETMGSQDAIGTQTQQQQISHPVLRVLLSKLRANVLGRVLGGEEERRRKESTASEALATAGMVEHTDRIKQIVDTLQRAKRVDWDAHKSWLNKVREEVDEDAAATSKEMLKA